MTREERKRIRQAARAAAQTSRRAQGLPEQITDPRVVEQIAALVRGVNKDRRAA
jgi:hypothetical protein